MKTHFKAKQKTESCNAIIGFQKSVKNFQTYFTESTVIVSTVESTTESVSTTIESVSTFLVAVLLHAETPQRTATTAIAKSIFFIV